VTDPDHDDCVRIHAALDHGINFIDTADAYSDGESEDIVGQALRGRRDDVVLATKVHFPMGEGRNRSGNSRRWILKAVAITRSPALAIPTARLREIEGTAHAVPFDAPANFAGVIVEAIRGLTIARPRHRTVNPTGAIHET